MVGLSDGEPVFKDKYFPTIALVGHDENARFVEDSSAVVMELGSVQRQMVPNETQEQLPEPGSDMAHQLGRK